VEDGSHDDEGTAGSGTFTELQRHAGELPPNPSQWMPWNYRETLARLG
jgi:hypothetical protein